MIFSTAGVADAQLRAALAAGDAEYERQTKSQEPRELTTDLGVDNFFEAEERLLERIPAHVRAYESITERELLEYVVRWKHPADVGRVRDADPSLVSAVTERAFRAASAREAIEALTDLEEVTTSTASAVLTFANPARYTVMDRRSTTGLRDLGYWELACEADAEHYDAYCLRCHELSQRTGLSLREVGRGLYVVGGE
jgi:hypothetical protein